MTPPLPAHWFGLRIRKPASTGPQWGARAILDTRGRRPQVDMVWDRQQAEGEDPAARQALVDWLNNYAIARMRREAIDLHDGPPHNVITFADRGFVIRSEARGGYLYMGACREADLQR